MAVELMEKQDGRILEFRVSGKLTKEDYERFVPEVERLLQKHGQLRLLLDMHDFHGWTAGALWQDTKFAWKHYRDIQRLAVVGEKTWQHGLAVFCKPFTAAEIRYFDRKDGDQAMPWLEGNKAEGNKDQNPVQVASQDSFPASDPPSWTPMTGAGTPSK